MTQLLSWDGAGDKVYQTGIDHGVLYVMDANGDYPLGVAWNGLVSITETPSGAEANKLYADNIKYLTLRSVEELGLTIEAYTYPDEFGVCDGSEEPQLGTLIGQQTRAKFGLCYRTVVGDDIDGNDLGYMLHLIYGLTASPSERAFSSINDSPEAIQFSWECESDPEVVTGYKPSSIVTIDSRTATPANLTALEVILYGDDVGPTDPTMPHIDAVLTTMGT